MKYLKFTRWIACFILIISTLLASFGQGKMVGVVTSEEREPVSYANVVLYTSADSTIAKFTVTQDDGTFLLDIPEKGNFWLGIHSIGMKDFVKEAIVIDNVNENLNLGQITMEVAATSLKEVVVTHKVPLVKMEAEKVTLNVENTINSVGTNAAEILRRAPGLRIDGDGEITIDGRKGIQVYVDDQLVNVGDEGYSSVLQGLQSSDIKSIEVIANPTAKYSAAGGAGIINVVLKKSTLRGFNNSVNTNLSYGITPKYNVGYNFNCRNKQINFFGNMSYYTGETEGIQDVVRQQISNNILTSYDQRSVMVGDADNFSVKLGLDIDLSPKSTLGGFVIGNYNDQPRTITNRASIYVNPESIDSTLKADNFMPAQINKTNYNLNYQYRGDGNHQPKFNFYLDFLDYDKTEDSNLRNIYSDPFGNFLREASFASNSNTNIELYSLKADYEQKALGGQLSLGFKGSMVNAGNDFQFFNVHNDAEIINNAQSRFFGYDESIYAGYVNYSIGFDAFYVNVGLRAEQTNGEGNLIPNEGDRESFTNDYLNFFPNLLISYRISDEKEWKFNYGRRIDRPRYESLNPFLVFIDELSFSSGNPFLQPQLSDNYNLSYRHKNIYSSLSYSKTNDYIIQVLEAVDNLRNFQTFDNLSDVDILSLSVSAGFNITPTWDSRVNTNLAHSGYSGNLVNDFLEVNNTFWSVSNEHNFRFKNGISAQIFGYYNSPMINGIFEMKSLWSVDFALSKKVLDGKGFLRIALTDVFKSWKNRSIIDYSGLYLNGDITWESRQAKISFNYSFGNEKLKQASNKQPSSSEEQHRL